MSYLSMRMREIRAEEARRAQAQFPTWADKVAMSSNIQDLVYGPMAMVDPAMQRLQDRAYARYEDVLLARNPHMREHINFRGRAG